MHAVGDSYHEAARGAEWPAADRVRALSQRNLSQRDLALGTPPL
jgi:hypothetical protein